MKKQEIYVVIDSEEKRDKSIKILTDAGEKLKNMDLEEGYKILKLNNEDFWWIGSEIENLTEITLDELKTLLKLKELTFPREMKVWNNNTMHIQDVVYSIYNEQYITMDSDGCFRGWLYACEIEPPKPSPIDEVIAFAESKGVVITGGLSMYKSLFEQYQEQESIVISSDQNRCTSCNSPYISNQVCRDCSKIQNKP